MRMLLLSCVLLCAFTVFRPARASVRVGPQVIFDTFQRIYPERGFSYRIGYGLSAAADLTKWLALDLAGNYSNAYDGFPNSDGVNDRQFSLLMGGIAKFYVNEPFYAAFKAGANYVYLTEVFHNFLTSSDTLSHFVYWRPYIGLEAAVIPETAFGVRESVIVFYDQLQKRPSYEFVFGISL